MAIDIHSHYLYGVDDGSKTLEMSMEMLGMAQDEGIKAMILTPHFEPDMLDELSEKRREHFKILKEAAAEAYPKLQLFPGNELYYFDGIIDKLEDGIAFTMNGTQYVLVEFGTYRDFKYIEKAVRSLLYAGYTPILAHIERYDGTKDPAHVRELVSMGAYMQINTETISGDRGFSKKRYALKLIKEGLVHFIGTDAHRTNWRPPEMKKAIEVIDKKAGRDVRKRLTEENPIKLLRGEEI